MSGLSNQNQKMEGQLGGKKVRRISEILKAEPSTFSGTSILFLGYCNSAESNLPQ